MTTKYVLLREVEDLKWEQVGVREARDSKTAVRDHCRNENITGSFVGVPVVSWNPRTVTRHEQLVME